MEKIILIKNINIKKVNYSVKLIIAMITLLRLHFPIFHILRHQNDLKRQWPSPGTPPVPLHLTLQIPLDIEILHNQVILNPGPGIMQLIKLLGLIRCLHYIMPHKLTGHFIIRPMHDQ